MRGGEGRQGNRAGGLVGPAGGQEQVPGSGSCCVPKKTLWEDWWKRGSHIHIPVSRRPRKTGRITELSDTAPFNGGQEKKCVWSQKRSIPKGREGWADVAIATEREVFQKGTQE